MTFSSDELRMVGTIIEIDKSMKLAVSKRNVSFPNQTGDVCGTGPAARTLPMTKALTDSMRNAMIVEDK